MRPPLIFLTAFLILSCDNSSTKTKQEPSNPQTYFFEKLDSIIVKDVIARVFIFQGFHEGQYFFRDMASSKVYLFDQAGELVDQWNKEGDVPGKFSMTASNISFDKKGNLVLLDIMEGIKILKKNSDVVHDFRVYQNQVSLGAAFSLFDTEQLIQKEGKEYLIYSLDIIEEYNQKYDPEFLARRKNLLVTDLETNETKEHIPFPEGSLFLNGKVYYFRDLRPIFQYDETSERLYLMFKSEPILYTYDWSGETPELIDQQTLPLEGFQVFEGFEVGAIDMGQIGNFQTRPYPSDIINISKYGDDLLISYSPTPQDKSAIERVIAGQSSDETKIRLRKEAQMRTVLRRQNGEIVPVELPEMYYNSFKVDGNTIYWMKKPDPNTEAEEFTLYWGELKAK
ncbi:hypothetical protein [Algoriphagus boritolerans]|uniref:TolB-like 6-blade propeller-like n=1 Tax=Algoriphagus boritolerans DSM 17298 = JCM 18970 TaxID=1120964 RepID=A0A1H5XU10_9BACT|nr:hypothetical protein [Algoriphagus boritolerans]SEG15168.1 hypothetical protein SAMN03080598_02675 [Algoriphagus boritolerans DSM 17298 = JCM 18970]